MVLKPVLKISLVALGVFCLSSGVVLGGVAYAYRNKFYPQVKVAGLDLAGKSKEEGSQLIKAKVSQYVNHPVKITIPDISQPVDPKTNRYPDLEIATTAEHLGMEFAGNQAVEQAWQIGHQRSLKEWFSRSLPALFSGSSHTITYRIDQTKVQSYIHTQVVPKIITPTPAKVTVSGAEVRVEAAKPGLEIDQAELEKELADSLETATDTDPTYLKAPARIVDSPITVPVVQPMADKLNNLGDLKITFTAENFLMTPKKADILAWFNIAQDNEGKLVINLQKEALAKYLQSNSKLDQSKSLTAAAKSLQSLIDKEPAGKSASVAVTLKPVAAAQPVTPGSYTANMFEGKYIEVSLGDQKMYLINGSNLEKTYTVSTGAWSTPTPVGTYHISGKTRRAYSAAYGLYMPYWQNFLGGKYGIHELPEWPNGYKEGESHLGTPVSHGCIRLGVGAAEEVYNWTSDGTPVYIHK